MQIFMMRGLAKFARRERISGACLIDAVFRAERGVIDAELGGSLIKQRVARQGQGRSGGYRMIIAHRSTERAIFLVGFAKNERQNVSPDELAALKTLAQVWLGATPAKLALAVHEGVLLEVSDGDP